MDERTARLLCEATRDFYRRYGASFSSTRRSAWPGWRRLLEFLPPGGGEPLAVLDLACGNLRFEAFLAHELAPRAVAFHAVDDCDALVDHGAPSGDVLDVRFQHLDVMATLLDAPGDAGEALACAISAPPCDLAACFGFMHHVPTASQRAAVLRALVGHTRPGGLVAVSLWRFLDDERFAAKAREQHAARAASLGLADLPENDCLLGWQGDPQACRYCHSFTEGEVDELVGAVGPWARQVARFQADGRTGAMNTYVVLRVEGAP